jgi:nicotinamidase-related amidase
MTLSTLDPHTALIVIDLQKGIVSGATAHPVAEVIGHASTLASAFRRHGLPVVLVNVDAGAPGRTDSRRTLRDLPADWTDLVPELAAQPQDLRITKHTWGAFPSTDLQARLRSLDVTQVVVVGVSTSIGVESTARQAYELGFHVTLATDAMTDTSAEAHANSVTRIFPRLGETGSTQEVLDLLDRTHGNPGA